MRVLLICALFSARPALAQGARAVTPQDARGASPQDAPLYNAARVAAIRTAPAETSPSPAVGQVNRGATVEVIARDRGWVRVRLEGWVREADLIVADSSLRPLSAADIRSDPVSSQGKLVRWSVQAISMQTADALRTGLRSGEQYLLALGPGAEKTLVYLVVPPALMPSARNLPAMADVVVIARVRNGRSEPAGVPILDLQSLTRQ
jgi:hypothetical protein